MLCYRCGTHVPDTAEKCPTCGQNLSNGGLRQATGTFSRRRAATSSIEGAPYKPQDLVANRYLIKDIAGAGPLGFVFRAHDKEIDVEVALKVINPKLLQSADERKQFARQIRLARKLSHPNLVRVYEEGEDAERPFFTSQFLDGLTLRKIIDLRLQKGQFFALAEIEPILTQICAALDGAHKVGPHSDLKPDNVLVLPDLLKVTDFGLGLAIPRLPFVQAMKARKSDRYLAPELVEGSEIDNRADIYSAGVILGEMLSGLTPDGAVPELQRRNPEVPQQLEGIYRKAVNSNPNARFKTAGELMAEISELAKKLAPPPPAKAPRVEPAAGVAPAPRPRTTTGMLQLSPRRDKPPPPVPEMPPPPPPESGENLMPDATQPVDPAQIARALKSESEARKDREETEVIDSGMFVAQLDNDDHVETRALVETVAPPPPPSVIAPPPVFASAQKPKKSRTWMLVTLLIVAGVGVGAGGGFWLIQRQKAMNNPIVEQPPVADDSARLAAEAAAKEKAAAEAAAIEKAADEKIAADKAAAEKAAAAKAEADRLAAERSKSQQQADDKAARAEAARQAKEAADREKAEKAAADKAAREAALAEKKAAAEKAAAERAAAKEKAEKEKLLASAAAPVAAGSGSCPDGMRPVAAGAFKMGTAPGDPMMGFDEKALSSVDVPAFCIDAFEYPNKRGASPTASIGFADAKRLCEAQSKRLCSEAEWEKACKGPGGSKWPYGASFDADSCNTEDDIGDARSLAPAGRFAKCRSGYGVADMSGNVAEWTSDRIIKGGSFASGDYAVRCSARKNGASFAKSTEVGFRCCSDQR